MSARKDFIRRLLQALWADYTGRVPYAGVYEQMVSDLGGVLVHDHVAFRSLGMTVGGQDLGIMSTYPIFTALGFDEKGAIDFPSQKLFARYAQHEEPDFPKVLVTQLKIEELDKETQHRIHQIVQHTRPTIGEDEIHALRGLDAHGEPAGLFEKTLSHFTQVPWQPPTEDVLLAVNRSTPYGAWTLLYGYNVSHFAAYVNRHGVDPISDIEQVVEELRRRGVPMRDQIEGSRASRLRQTSTQAVRIPVKLSLAGGETKQIEWPYSAMEFAERGVSEEGGEHRLFQGFLGPQTADLLEMTRT